MHDQHGYSGERELVHRKEMILNCRIKSGVERVVCLVSVVRADWSVMACYSNLGDTIIVRVLVGVQIKKKKNVLFVCLFFIKVGGHISFVCLGLLLFSLGRVDIHFFF